MTRGNFAFLTEHNSMQLKTDVLAALNTAYEVKGAVVVERYRVEEAFEAVAKLCRQIYGEEFRPRSYLVRKDCQPWRLGMVLVQELYDKRISCVEEITNCHDARIEVLALHDGFIGLLKFDPKKPRVPWGEPAQTVEGILARRGDKWLATGRSARTIRGILRKFSCPTKLLRTG